MLKELVLNLKRKNKNTRGDKGHPFYKVSLVYLLAIMFFDIVFYILAKGNTQVNIIYLLINNICLAVFFSSLTFVFEIKGFIITQVFILMVMMICITEIALFKTYAVIMSPSMILSNASNVFAHYGGEFKSVLLGNIFYAVAFILIFIAYIYFSYRFIYKIIKSKRRTRKKVSKKPIYISLVISIVVYFLSLFMINMQKDVTYNAFRYGIKTAMLPNIVKTSKGFLLQKNQVVFNDGNIIGYIDEYNAFDIDYKNLDAGSEKDLVDINNYVSTLVPTKKNEYTGIFKGKNLILICAEAYSHYVLDPNLTPTLYRLTNNGFRFNDFYVPSWGGSTSTGEYAFLTGLIPCDGADTMKETIGKNMAFTMPKVLKEQGYNTGAYHNGNYKYYDRHLTHKDNLGFDYFYATGNGLEKITTTWPTDMQMMEDTFKTYFDKEPFCMYYMTLSGHAFYNDTESYKVVKSIEKVNAKYGDEYPEQVKNYICYQIYLEDAVARLVELLTEKNMLDDTVICLVADHFPYGLNSETFTDGINYLAFLYDDVDIDMFELDFNKPILWSSTLEKEYKDLNKDVNEPSSTIDLLPTLLNLFGIEFDSRLLPGRDVFSDAMAIVPYNSGAFITTKCSVNNEGKIKYLSDEKVSSEYIKLMREVTKNKILYSDFVLKKDYFDYILKNKK